MTDSTLKSTAGAPFLMEVAARTDADKKGGPETLGLETGLSFWGPAYFQRRTVGFREGMNPRCSLMHSKVFLLILQHMFVV